MISDDMIFLRVFDPVSIMENRKFLVKDFGQSIDQFLSFHSVCV